MSQKGKTQSSVDQKPTYLRRGGYWYYADKGGVDLCDGRQIIRLSLRELRQMVTRVEKATI